MSVNSIDWLHLSLEDHEMMVTALEANDTAAYMEIFEKAKEKACAIQDILNAASVIHEAYERLLSQ